ncbi:MAG: hypothetical protein JOY80_00125 [Candidatus Dormibacteraeota bacterium]|nr:hypothetical protein [Candidatus Dormibacteraeota bacterium]
MQVSTARAVALPLLVVAASLRSLGADGYLIQVDSAFGPRIATSHVSFYAPVQLLVDALQVVFGGQWAGRFYAAGTLFLVGFAAMVLLRRLPWYAQMCGGLLAMLNPFVYDRLVGGQWGVVGAIAGLLFVVAAWRRMRDHPGRGSAIAISAAIIATLMFSADFAGMLFVLGIGLCFFSSMWRDPKFRLWTLTGLGATAVIALYGVIPFVFGTGPGTYTQVASFTVADFASFRTTAAPDLGVIPALIGLYGEWSERLATYVVADQQYSWWFVSAAALSACAVIGGLFSGEHRWMLGVGVIGIAISAVTATAQGLQWMTDIVHQVPIVAAFREPQKWDALWLVALIVLVPAAISGASGQIGRSWATRRAIASAMVVVVLAATLAPSGWTALLDTSRVVTPVQYPSSWYAAATFMAHGVDPRVRVAVLPWHEYEELSFVGRPSADPAEVFFPGTLAVSSDPELPGAPASDPIEAASRSGLHCALAEALRGQGISITLVLQDTIDGAQTADALLTCGFAPRFTTTDVVVLRDTMT